MPSPFSLCAAPRPPGGAGTRGWLLAGQAPRRARPPTARGGLCAPRGTRGAEGPLEGAGELKPESSEPPRNFGRDCAHFLPGGRLDRARPQGGRRLADGTMRPLLCALAGLTLLRAAGADAAAEPFIPSRGDPARSTGCDAHMAVHDRLDVTEEKVEKTVEYLEAEVKGLLSQLEELAWNLPPAPLGPNPDLLGEDQF
ncbi:placenta-specific protein 9 isoform X2 [Saccopteryx bilineata]|uniref:placenta-specific protein 9 isoform X2 n=1 Tax=Saccopteryx bilineata TaxID=59482 RepID=UPI00338DBD83